jgi:hypothetical protein
VKIFATVAVANIVKKNGLDKLIFKSAKEKVAGLLF